MNRKSLLLLLLAALLLRPAAGLAAAAAAPDPRKLEKQLIENPDLPALIAYGYATNPEIKAARAGWQAEVARYRVETGYPDPQLNMTYYPEPIETRLGPQDWNLTFSQTIPFPGKLSKMGEMVAKDARLAQLELDRAVRELVVSLRESYHELLYLQTAARIAKQNQELVAHLRQVGETAYAEERTTLVDVTKAQSQAAQLRYDLLLLQELIQTEKARLNAMLDRPPAAAIGELREITPGPVVYELNELYELAARNREELQMAAVRVEKAEAKKDLAGYQFLPDFRVGLFYAEIGEPEGLPTLPQDAGRDAVGVQFGLSVPLWFGKNKGRLDQARAEKARAEALADDQLNDTRAMVRELFFRVENADRLVRLYSEELLPQAAQALETAETWSQEGQGSFSDFIETQATWYNFQLARARAAADYAKFLARLERLTGTDLTHKDAPNENPSAPAAVGGQEDAS